MLCFFSFCLLNLSTHLSSSIHTATCSFLVLPSLIWNAPCLSISLSHHVHLHVPPNSTLPSLLKTAFFLSQQMLHHLISTPPSAPTLLPPSIPTHPSPSILPHVHFLVISQALSRFPLCVCFEHPYLHICLCSIQFYCHKKGCTHNSPYISTILWHANTCYLYHRLECPYHTHI